MKIELYAIKDELANTMLQPMEFKTENEAKRTFKILINDKNNSLMYSCPGDYSLWKIGEFEKDTGEIFPILEKIENGRTVWKGDETK